MCLQRVIVPGVPVEAGEGGLCRGGRCTRGWGVGGGGMGYNLRHGSLRTPVEVLSNKSAGKNAGEGGEKGLFVFKVSPTPPLLNKAIIC